VPTLYKDRFVLVGDAGYAAGPTGTGTSLAMVGAYILSGEISKSRNDLAAGPKAYKARMKLIVKDMYVIPTGILTFMVELILGRWIWKG
jgi:flavin-dependent dehydrogenase